MVLGSKVVPDIFSQRVNLSSLVTDLSIGVDTLACESFHQILVRPLC